MHLNSSCAVAGLPCLKIACYRIGGKLALSLNRRTKDELQDVAGKDSKDDQLEWGDDELDEAMTPVKKVQFSLMALSCTRMPCFFLYCQRIPVVDLRIVNKR